MLSLHSRFGFCSRATVAAALLAAILGQQAMAAGDAERGKVLGDTCNGCHGIDSYTNVYPTYHVPRIAGQSYDYLVAALTLYRDGNRAHPTMAAQAGSFSDADIQDLAAWISTNGPQLKAAEASPKGTAPQAAQVCAACHGPAGVSAIPTNPHLAGQHLDYIQQALKQYKAGERKGPNAVAMQAQLMAVSDEDLEAIARFYAAQDGLDILQDD